MSVTDRDNGYRDLLKRVWGIKRPSITVGILTGQGAEDEHRDEGPGEHKELVTLLMVAIWNEFGTQNIPARSFIRAWYDEAREELREDLRKLMVTVVKGERTKEQALQLLAVKAVGAIQQRISDGIDPENARSTVKQKGSSKPLIESGQLRAGVTSRIDYG